MTEPKLLTPFAEAEPGFALEQPLDGALAGSRQLRQLDQRASIGRLLLQHRGNLFCARVARDREMDRVGLHDVKMIEQNRHQVRVSGNADIQAVELDDAENQFAE